MREKETEKKRCKTGRKQQQICVCNANIFKVRLTQSGFHFLITCPNKANTHRKSDHRDLICSHAPYDVNHKHVTQYCNETLKKIVDPSFSLYRALYWNSKYFCTGGLKMSRYFNYLNAKNSQLIPKIENIFPRMLLQEIKIRGVLYGALYKLLVAGEKDKFI